MNLDTLFTVASPATLASLIADVEAMGPGATQDARLLERRARRVLASMVGVNEAARMIDVECRAVDVVDLAEMSAAGVSRCPRCEGTGQYSRLGEPSHPCAVCDGAGTIADVVDLSERPGEWTAEEIQRREA